MSSLIRCPSCDSTLQVPEDRLGRSVKCGRCEAVFTPTATETRDREPYVRREEPPPRSDSSAGRRRPRYDDDDDDFDDHPRRRRPRYDDDEFDDRYYDIRRRDGYSRSEALSRVSGPGILLMIMGALYFLMAIGCVAGAVWALSEMNTGPKRPNVPKDPDPVPVMVFCSLGAICGFICGPIVFLGGYRMRQLRSWGLALTATILTFVVGGMVCLFLMLLGIWPLIVLVDSKVKRAFELEAQRAAH
jgi:predicted Zn finger-like uncharacterized protein